MVRIRSLYRAAFFMLACAVLICGPGGASAAGDSVVFSRPEDGWQAFIAGHELLPQQLVAVDKNRQLLFLFERRSPLRIAGQYVCTTGRATGDKFESGDLKTPEGVYFVVRHLNSGLDFIKYGNEAYTLNYPNPVDRLRRKTGYGIWIHGRGEPIQPRLTEGCVSLNNGDIAVLGKNLLPGTPVALASSVVHAMDFPAPDSQTLLLLEQRTRDWARAWSSRSMTFFDFYDPEAYGVAQGEAFSAFRAQKERMFKRLAWIDTSVRDVRVMPGPGYWVSWFFQSYKAPNLSTQGVRRLYWQPDGSGQYRIVGMEWLPNMPHTLPSDMPHTLMADNSGTLPAGALPATAAAAPASAPLAVAAVPAAIPDSGPTPAQRELPAPRPETPAPLAGVSAAPVAPVVPVAPAAPAAVPGAAPAVAPAVALAPEASAPPVPGPVPSQAPSPALNPALNPEEQLAADGSRFIERWRNAWESGDLEAYMACYAPDAVQGTRKGAKAIDAHKRVTWKKKSPSLITLSNMRISVTGDKLVADMVQEYADSSGYTDSGIKTLTIRRDAGALRIVQEDWTAETP